jgi:hypothetical protein
MTTGAEDLTELTAEMVTDGIVPRTPAVSPDGRWVVHTIGTMGQAGAAGEPLVDRRGRREHGAA